MESESVNSKRTMHLATVIAENDQILDPRIPEEFAQLVDLHHRELLVYARALTGEENTSRDLVQDAFIVAFQKVNTFDITRDFPTWMRGIVRNKWREWLRKNKRYQLTDNDVAIIDADIAHWQSEKANSNSSVFHALESCLERLPENLHDTVRSFYYDGRSGDEAAEHLGVASAAIRKRLQRARTLLKDCVENKLGTLSPN
ncbi:MAG: sigma-70 family RNA polymerase sigma factor [Verrucomicrobiota bacterium]